MSISIKNLTKAYSNRFIFHNLNFKFEKNKKYFIKGENGIGKTTLIKCILNQITYDGIISIKGDISYCPDNYNLPNNVTIYSFIKVLSGLDSKIEDFDDRLNKYLDLFLLSKYKNSYIGTLSKGQKEKVNIINSLIANYNILIMDEPFSGLDEDSINSLKIELINLDKTIIIISHLDVFKDTSFIYLKLEENEIIKIS